MPTTTTKVDSAIRDRLAHLARARGTTMSALLSDVAERLETEQRWLSNPPTSGRNTRIGWVGRVPQ